MQNILLSGEKSLDRNCAVLLPQAVGSVPGARGCPKLAVTAPAWGRGACSPVCWWASLFGSWLQVFKAVAPVLKKNAAHLC